MDILGTLLGGFGDFNFGGIGETITNFIQLIIDPEGYIQDNQPGETSSIVVNSSGSSES
ncbi:MAG TPA: hypothetical protein VFC72_05235 [Corynebacterium sp.]|nr:hypothetical protein [Corynebacterium sp.]